MMYPFLTLDDQTEIVHSKLLEDGSVKVYIEEPGEKDRFHYATASLTLEMISASWNSPRDCAAIFIMKIRSLLEVSFICSERCLRKRRTKMELVTIEVKLPKEVYDSASEILAKQGLTMEDALILFLKETVRLGRIPFDYTEEDLEEARRWERIVNDDVQDTGGEETCMVN